MKFRFIAALVVTMLVGTLAPLLLSERSAKGCAIDQDTCDWPPPDNTFHVDEPPPTYLELVAPDVADPDAKVTFTGTVVRDREPATGESVDLMVDGQDVTQAVTDTDGAFQMEYEMYEATAHSVQAIASRGSDDEVAGAILEVGVRPVRPELWVGDDDDTGPVVQGWAREGTTVNLFTDVACEFAPAVKATPEELEAGVPLSVVANTTTKVHANVTNERGLTSDCSDAVTIKDDSQAPVVSTAEATPVRKGIAVTWSRPLDESGSPERATTEVCAAEGALASGDACFTAANARIIKTSPAATRTTITGLRPKTTYSVALRFTDKVGNNSVFFIGNYLVKKGQATNQINAKHNALRNAGFDLGAATSEVRAVGEGWFQDFTGGTIYYSESSGAHEVHGLIRLKLNQLGGGNFGFPTTDETSTPDGRGRFNHFTGGKSIYWTPQTGANAIFGAIREKWESIGGAAVYGYPVTDELTTPNGRGKYNHFEGGRSIYWSPQTQAHTVYSPIRDKWAALGWENGFLGFPATDQTRTPDGRGEFVHFQGGSIYYSPNSGTHEIHGPIWDKWASVGFERGYGYPVTDVVNLGDGRGQYTHFENGRSIYFTPQTGAHLVYGRIRDKWASMGWERGAMGYPITDEEQRADFRVSRFEGGSIVWNGNTALYVRGVQVAAVLVSDDDGGRAASLTTNQISQVVERNNNILMKAGIQLTFNNADVRTYRNSGTNNLNVIGDGTDDVNRWMEQNFPRHLGIFFHQNGAWTANHLRMVFLTANGGPNPETLAHEVGHWLDLQHTFLSGGNPQDSVTDTTSEVLQVAGGPGGENRLDGDGLADTPPDPGATFVTNNRPAAEYCGQTAFTVRAPAPQNWSLTFNPQRKNLESYFAGCTRDIVTPQQVNVMRAAQKGYIVTDWRF